jgi:hypothetical protein
MPYKLVYFDEVKQDIQEAKEWYRLQVKGLEKRFAQDIKSAILRLKERPTVHAIRYKNVRIAHPDVFPYAIHFYVDEPSQTIIITAIVHNRRNPIFSRKRT